MRLTTDARLALSLVVVLGGLGFAQEARRGRDPRAERGRSTRGVVCRVAIGAMAWLGISGPSGRTDATMLPVGSAPLVPSPLVGEG